MKIDLHCHTNKTKKGDGETRNVDEKRFREAVLSAGVKIVAITNHNIFDIGQYNSFVAIAGSDFQVWPGIELDVNGETHNGHVIIVNNPRTVNNFDLKIKELIGNKTPDEVLINIDDLIRLFADLDAIILPHYYKPKSLDDNSIQKIKESISDKSRFFYEPSNYRSMGILINHDQSSLMGSDVKDWSKYEQSNFSELKLDVDSFEQFLLLAKKDPKLVDTLLNKKKKTMIDISHKDKNSKNNSCEEVPIYDDINIIFGTKGTGKSDALVHIKQYYNSKNIEYSYYSPSNTNDEINSKLNVSDSERKLGIFGKDNCATEFNYISNWSESAITQLKDYNDYILTAKINTNKGKLKILNTKSFHDISDKEVNKQKYQINILNSIFSELNKIDIGKHLDYEDKSKLISILEKLESSLYSCFKDDLVDYESMRLSNLTLDKIKQTVEENTETKTKPSKTGLFDFVNNRLELVINAHKICDGFRYQFSSEPFKVGQLEEGKTLYMITQYRMYNSSSKRKEFAKIIKNIKETKKIFDELICHLYSVDIDEIVGEFRDKLREYEISSLDDFLGVKKVFTLKNEKADDIEEYIPSTGEATMIILQEKLNDNKDVFILDEPEKSLGNTYVNDIIVPKLVSLAKSKKVVVVVTHNANIAVRTFPYTSILKTYIDGKYITYVGNPFVDKLVQIGNENNTLNWKEESIKILEGGKLAFDERGEIYGRNK